MSDRWFIRGENTDIGPLSWEQLQQLVAVGQLPPQALVREESDDVWRSCAELGLAPSVQATKILIPPSKPSAPSDPPRGASSPPKQPARDTTSKPVVEAQPSPQPVPENKKPPKRRRRSLSPAEYVLIGTCCLVLGGFVFAIGYVLTHESELPRSRATQQVMPQHHALSTETEPEQAPFNVAISEEISPPPASTPRGDEVSLGSSPGAPQNSTVVLSSPTNSSPPVSPANISTEDLVQQAVPSVAVIMGRMTHGTGFVVNPEVLVTNRHVIDDILPNELKIQFPSAPPNMRGPYQAKLLYKHPRWDLALLGAEIPHQPLPLEATDHFQRGQEVLVIGNPGVGDAILENAVSRGLLECPSHVERFAIPTAQYFGQSR
ncbi:MAG: hypothetical protein KatS3mg114_0982 [Planctomycetaceae bacterium]|nr:MAG: hypothetical protein KatS3mg114_0982 [Planctomycetaceae bacterium]